MRERTPEEQAKAAEIKTTLRHCTGAETLFQTSTAGIIITDGVKLMADLCGAFWLIDLIASHIAHNRRLIPDEAFQVWRLALDEDGDGARVYCDDGQDKRTKDAKPEAMMQAIPYTDFPLEEIKIWVVKSDTRYTMMLPSEY
jgi:hypothetical protein